VYKNCKWDVGGNASILEGEGAVATPPPCPNVATCLTDPPTEGRRLSGQNVMIMWQR